MTSSVTAMYYGMTGRDRTYTEADWSDLASPATNAYAKSKTIAERAARDWVAAEGGGMEFCTIDPPRSSSGRSSAATSRGRSRS